MWIVLVEWVLVAAVELENLPKTTLRARLGAPLLQFPATRGNIVDAASFVSLSRLGM